MARLAVLRATVDGSAADQLRAQLMRVALIPARGGSKRIPRKNVKLFNGRPMIGYAIDAAIKSSLFGRIIVSTDDEEIARVSRDLGAETPFVRPMELADDHATTAAVVRHAATFLKQDSPECVEVCCIYPCVPTLLPSDLILASSKLAETGADFAYPILRFPSSPFRAMTRDSSGRMKFIFPEFELTRTQDLEPCFHDAGQFYFGRIDAWLSSKPMHSSGIGLEIGQDRLVDIDTPEDWARAERRVLESAGS